MAIPESWRHNLGLKLLSAGLALLLYFHVHGTKIVEREVSLPVRVENLPDSLMLLEEPPEAARVLVSGPAQELFFLRFVPGAGLRVDLAGARPPSLHHALGPADVTLGDEERLVPLRVVEPRTLELGIDRRVTRDLPVRPVYSGQAAPGHVVAGTRVEPEKVRCTGPATQLAGLRQIPTQPVDLSGKSEPFASRVDVEPGRPLVSCEPPTVSVVASVEPERQRALLERPVVVVNPPAGGIAVEVRPARVSITVSGPRQSVEELDPDQVQVVLDAGLLRDGDRQRMRLETRLPDWAQLDRLEPDSVEVVVRRRARRR